MQAICRQYVSCPRSGIFWDCKSDARFRAHFPCHFEVYGDFSISVPQAFSQNDYGKALIIPRNRT